MGDKPLDEQVRGLRVHVAALELLVLAATVSGPTGVATGCREM
jgi:hypothetical protein